jgi:hypothetical protein
MRRYLLAAFLRISFWLAALLWAGHFPAHSQSVQQVHPQPDCQIFFTMTANGAVSGQVDNRQQGCNTWSVVYNNSGFSAASVLLQSAANNAGVPATFGTGFPVQQTIVTGTNPMTSTVAGYLWVVGINAFVRVKITTTGSGVINGCLLGWRIPNAQ